MQILLSLSISLLAGLMLSRVAKLLQLPAVTAYLVAGILIGPYVLGVVWKRTTRAAMWASVISTLSLTVTLILVFGFGKNNWDCSLGTAIKSGVGCSPLIGTICILSSLVITFVVSLLTKAPSEEIINNAFEKSFEGEIK